MSLNEIQMLAEKYNLRINLVDGLMYINSADNFWYFDMGEVETGSIILYHQSKNKKKTSFHKQRIFRDIPFLMKSIYEHENHMYGKRKKSKREQLFDLIALEKNSCQKKVAGGM